MGFKYRNIFIWNANLKEILCVSPESNLFYSKINHSGKDHAFNDVYLSYSGMSHSIVLWVISSGKELPPSPLHPVIYDGPVYSVLAGNQGPASRSLCVGTEKQLVQRHPPL